MYDVFIMDMGGHDANVQTLVTRFPHAQIVRYYDNHLDTIHRCVNRARTPSIWIISSCCDYTNFDFDYRAAPWEAYQIHCWSSGDQKFGDTFLIPVVEFNKQADIELLEWYKDINWHSDGVQRLSTDTFIMNMGGHDNNVNQLQQLSNSQTVRYYDNHLDTIRRCIAKASTPAVWVISSCCDYTNFDFTQTIALWGLDQLHCWASGDQKFGDTFLINVCKFRRQQDIELLEWYKDINWHEQGVPRLSWPILTPTTEDITKELKQYKFNTPYIWVNAAVDFDVPLWSKRALYTFNNAGSISVAPRDIQAHLVSQIYDYPYISKEKTQFLDEKLQDVVFISNGEPMAEDNWNNLKSICPRAKRSNGVTGREAAYKAAAKLSETPWFFAVFAKTEVLPTFKFDFQPDYLQEPKHYIFHSRNPLNGLEYGAMNINLYNKQLVLDTVPGIDFTLSAAHAVVPICASISRFNTDPWITWRSAFREVLKLRQEVEQGADVEIQYRLSVWMTKAIGENAEYCLRGAQDADQYYTSVNGDADKLQLSFDWAWLQDYYYSLYNSQPWLESV